MAEIDRHPGVTAAGTRPQGAAGARANARPVEPSPTAAPRGPAAKLALGLLVGAVLALACWLQGRAVRTAQATYAARLAALERMQSDADRIRALRQTPRLAAERQRPDEELLGTVEQALQAAGVPADLWQDSIPQAPVRLPQSPYQRHSTRLYFEDLTLEQIVRFTHALLETDPSLAIPALHLSGGARAESATWNVDLAVSYLVYAPAGDR